MTGWMNGPRTVVK